MAHIEARAWWADVEHLRDDYERTAEARRRADLADVAARRGSRERPHVEADAARAATPPRRGERAHGTAIPARRTVEIRGRTVPAPIVPRSVEVERRRPPRRAVERVGPRPDRVAMWALLMGIVLILVAVGTADASVLAR
jgi:hypothetical protein